MPCLWEKNQSYLDICDKYWEVLPARGDTPDDGK